MEMKDSGVDIIGKIPQKWEIKRLKYLVSITTGSQDTQDASDGGAYPFYVRSPKVERINKYVFDGEAILMAGDGVGAGKVFHYVNGKFGCHQRVYIIHSFKNVKPLFLFQYIRSLFSVEIEKGSAKSTVDSIRLPMLQNFFVVLPSLPEQQLIADFLDSETKKIDDILNDLRSQIDIMTRHKKSLITETITKGLNPDVPMKDSGINWIGKIPYQWGIKKIRYVTHVRNEKAWYNPTCDVYLGLENIESGTGRYIASDTTYAADYYDVFKSGDVMFNKLRPYLAKTIMPDFDGYCTGELIVIKDAAIFKRYLYYYFFSDGFLEMVNASTYGAKMPRASWEYIKNLHITYPNDPEEQRHIVGFLDAKCAQIDSIIQDKQAQVDKLESYKKSLIYEYVTGKKRVKGVVRHA